MAVHADALPHFFTDVGRERGQQVHQSNYGIFLHVGPWGIAVDDEHVYVADTWNHRIQKFTLDGEFVDAFGANQFGELPGVHVAEAQGGDDQVELLSCDLIEGDATVCGNGFVSARFASSPTAAATSAASASCEPTERSRATGLTTGEIASAMSAATQAVDQF